MSRAAGTCARTDTRHEREIRPDVEPQPRRACNPLHRRGPTGPRQPRDADLTRGRHPDLQDPRSALLRLAGALGRAEARHLARPQRGAAVETLIVILAAAALLAAALASAIR